MLRKAKITAQPDKTRHVGAETLHPERDGVSRNAAFKGVAKTQDRQASALCNRLGNAGVLNDDLIGTHAAKAINAQRQRTIGKLEGCAAGAAEQAEIGICEAHVCRTGLKTGRHVVAHGNHLSADLGEGQITAELDKVCHIGRQALDADRNGIGRNRLGKAVIKP